MVFHNDIVDQLGQRLDGTLNVILFLLIDNNTELGDVVPAYFTLVQRGSTRRQLVMLTTTAI